MQDAISGTVGRADACSPVLARIENVSKRFGGYTAIRDLTLDIRQGEFLALLGPSGCGKTTLLRLLAGFETADEGRILMQGRDLKEVPPYRRPVNTMFQSYALFPHLTVAANIAFGLHYDGLAKHEIASRVSDMLALVKLEGLERRKPDALSGGQRQRVALARALAKRPQLLLLDEPMAALDRKLREGTQRELIELQRQLGTTFVIVTHDKDEAMTMADRIAVMEHGQIAQIDTPLGVYEHPASRYVADFLGEVNLIEGRLGSDAGRSVVEVSDELRFKTAARLPAPAGSTVWLAFRPEAMRMAREAPAVPVDGIDALAGRVVDVNYRGDVSNYLVQLDNGPAVKAMVVNAGRNAPRASVNDRVWLSFDPAAGSVLTR